VIQRTFLAPSNYPSEGAGILSVVPTTAAEGTRTGSARTSGSNVPHIEVT